MVSAWARIEAPVCYDWESLMRQLTFDLWKLWVWIMLVRVHMGTLIEPCFSILHRALYPCKAQDVEGGCGS